MSRWEIDLRYDRKLQEGDIRYLEVVRLAHPEVGYLRYRHRDGALVITVETDAETRELAVARAMVQSKQLWVHSQPVEAEVAVDPSTDPWTD
jgi:hypothetical protein